MNFILEAIQNAITLKSRFIIHHHFADRAGEHFDLRIEKDGVLKSWATRKLDDLLENPTIKIQLFQTPDHNLEEWINFKGHIPSGEYGGGTVEIFDKGSVKIIKWDDKSKVVIFNGKKINGKYAIIQPKQNMYMMLKMKL